MAGPMLAVDRPLPEATADAQGTRGLSGRAGGRKRLPSTSPSAQSDPVGETRGGGRREVAEAAPPSRGPSRGRTACRLPSWGPARPEEGRCSSGSEANGGGRGFRHATTRRGQHGEGAARAEWSQRDRDALPALRELGGPRGCHTEPGERHSESKQFNKLASAHARAITPILV